MRAKDGGVETVGGDGNETGSVKLGKGNHRRSVSLDICLHLVSWLMRSAATLTILIFSASASVSLGAS